jgi:hypothetical protein
MLPSQSLLVVEPPATRTLPFERSVAVWHWRPSCIFETDGYQAWPSAKAAVDPKPVKAATAVSHFRASFVDRR